MNTWGTFAAVAVGAALTLTGCNIRPSNEEETRTALREHAAGVLERFGRTIDRASSPEDLEQRIKGFPTLYAFAWDDDMEPVADVYLQQYAGRGGGWWAQDYRVKACVRYSVDAGERVMKSVDCPSARQFDEHAEVVPIP
ncbi:hypothetical protein [Arthrobacter sp. ISL-69]|uniref:hypothetical protein n=1 Tax=Arthrobacter sp. ISL-69 TaxID=2819113 RepID=UPI001BE9F753|nr:hypothetical protein [Arthrobacter sp. ISL-69]MBT2538975.1 hypothetical protein [Arthrobacter sp. ISL-69]